MPIRAGGEQKRRGQVLRRVAHEGPGARRRVPPAHARGCRRPGHRQASPRSSADGKING